MKMIQSILLLTIGFVSICGAQWVRYEAENATLSNGASVANDANASGGKYVDMGSGRIDFTVSAPKAETYLLRISNKGSNATSRQFENIEVNGTKLIDQQYSAGYLWDPA